MMRQSIDLMRQALELAEQGINTVSPNPAVGCVIVHQNQIIARGTHRVAGQPHAEILALREAGDRARGGILYVTLEPCCHYGRTPPCVKAIIHAGIKKVVMASQDPNPVVKGRGIAALVQAGIEVEVGLADAENRYLNRTFFHYQQTRRPWVIAKWAMSLDGKQIVHAGDSPQITAMHSQQRVHQLRNRVDAILIGAKTAITDNPQLTVRLTDIEPIRQPLPIILSRQAALPLHLTLLAPNRAVSPMVVTTASVAPHFQQAMAARGGRVWQLPATTYQTGDDDSDLTKVVDLEVLLDKLGQCGITSLLVEGGALTHQQFFAANLVNECHCYLAPVLIGPWRAKQVLQHAICEPVGQDWHYSTLICPSRLGFRQEGGEDEPRSGLSGT